MKLEIFLCIGLTVLSVIAFIAPVVDSIWSNYQKKRKNVLKGLDKVLEEFDIEQVRLIHFLTDEIDEDVVSEVSRFYIYDVADYMVITNPTKAIKEFRKLNDHLYRCLEQNDSESEEFKSSVLGHLRKFLLKHDKEHTKLYIDNYDFGKGYNNYEEN